MIKRCMHAGILTIVFPFLVSAIAYYGFATNYTKGVFHEAGFRAQYESGIYRYRVLGRLLLLRTHRFIASQSMPARAVRRMFARVPASLARLDPRADATFYAAYFVQNTFFMILSCVVLYFLLPRGPTASSGPYAFGVLLMGMTQYVVSPYDTLSHSLLLLSFLLTMRPFRFRFPSLVLVLCVSVLVRESAALTLSFYVAWHHRDLIRLRRGTLGRLALLVGVFVATYLSLRVCFGRQQAAWQTVMLQANLASFSAWCGITALAVVSYMLCAGSPRLRQCLVFLAAALPYLLVMVVIACAWEIRLWVPVWLGLLCLAQGVPGNGGEAPGDRSPERFQARRRSGAATARTSFEHASSV